MSLASRFLSVLFRFVFTFFLSLNPRPFVQSFFDMHAYTQLANNCLCPLFCLFFVSLEVSLFQSIMDHCRFLLYGEYAVRFPSRLSFLPCDHELGFDISLLCDDSTNQSAGRPGGSVSNLETFRRWDVSSNLGVVTRTGIFPHKKTKKCPTSGERLYRKYAKFDFTVDEGKEWLNPFREKN